MLAWAVLSLAAAGFSWQSHRRFSTAITEAFNQQQGLGVRLIERLVQQHINEAMLLLTHVRDEIRRSAETGPPDFSSFPAAVASRRLDQFIALSVFAEDGSVLFASQPTERWDLVTLARVETVDPETVMTPFLSERFFTPAGRPTAFVVVPFRLRGGAGGLFYVAGELNIRHYMLTALQTVIGKDIGLLIADGEGDIYLIANVEHTLPNPWSREHLTAGANCQACHAAGSFDDLKQTKPATSWSTPTIVRRGARCSTG